MSCCAIILQLLDKHHSDVNGYSDCCTKRNGFREVAALLIVTD